MRSLDPHFGRPVTGDQFWPRKVPLNQTMRALRKGGSVSLFGPRRTGKSSIMAEAARLLRDEGFHCIEIDLEGRAGPGSFIANLIRAVPKNTRDGILTAWTQLGDIPSSLGKLIAGAKDGDDIAVSKESEKLFRTYWETLSDTFLKQAKKSDKKIILFLDELPFFCNDQIEHGVEAQFIDAFLATLRRWRQDKEGIPMAICGSIGMHHLLRTHGIDADHMNDLTEVWLEAPDRADAAAMLDALAKGESYAAWSDTLRDAVLDECADFMPSYLQKAFDAVVVSEAKTANDVAKAFDQIVRPDFERSFFNQFNKRIKRYKDETKERATAAVAVLKIINGAGDDFADRDEIIAAAISAGLEEDEAEQLLFEMADDGFLRDLPDAGQVRFGMALVGSWYRRRYGRAK